MVRLHPVREGDRVDPRVPLEALRERDNRRDRNLELLGSLWRDELNRDDKLASRDSLAQVVGIPRLLHSMFS